MYIESHWDRISKSPWFLQFLKSCNEKKCTFTHSYWLCIAPDYLPCFDRKYKFLNLKLNSYFISAIYFIETWPFNLFKRLSSFSCKRLLIHQTMKRKTRRSTSVHDMIYYHPKTHVWVLIYLKTKESINLWQMTCCNEDG